jgi:hypothetical protein
MGSAAREFQTIQNTFGGSGIFRPSQSIRAKRRSQSEEFAKDVKTQDVLTEFAGWDEELQRRVLEDISSEPGEELTEAEELEESES